MYVAVILALDRSISRLSIVEKVIIARLKQGGQEEKQ